MYTQQHYPLLITDWTTDMAGPAPDRARDAKGTFVPDEASAARDAHAFGLRAKGRSLGEIADQLGYYDRSAVRQAFNRHLGRVVDPAVREYRMVMDEQLDYLYRKAIGVLEADHFKLHDGAIVLDPVTGARLIDDAPVLAAVNTALKVQERRAKLWGLDAPTKVEAQVHSVKVTVDGAEDV